MTATAKEALSFLSGGGEMAERTRTFDWSQTSIGAPAHWPFSLRTSVSNMLRTEFPMLVLWGEEFICFYNDAFMPTLDDNYHPALGKPARDVWRERWNVIGPQLQSVMATGNPVTFRDRLTAVVRNGRSEEVYWTFCYSQILDDQGAPGGVLVTCMETTQTFKADKKVSAREQSLRHIISQAPFPIFIFRGFDFVVETANNHALEFWDKSADQVIGKPLFAGVPEVLTSEYQGLLQDILKTGKPYTAVERPVALSRNGQLQTLYINFAYQPLFDEDGVVSGILGTAADVTEQVSARQNRVYETVIGATPDLVYVFDLNYKFTYANRALLTMWGKSWQNAVGVGLRENGYEEWHAAMHEREIDHVVATGESIRGEVSFPHATLGRRVYDYIFVPVLNERGEVEAVAGTTRDVSDMKLIESSLRESEARFRTLVRNAPVAIAVFRGHDFVTELANDAYLALVDKKESEFLNRPLFETLPEVRPAIESVVRNVVSTGETFHGREFNIPLKRKGKVETAYFNFTYSPLLGSNNLPDGFIVVASEVTEQVQARLKVEESEVRFRTMAEISPVLIAVENEVGLATYFNKGWVELTGRARNELLKSGWLDLIHPDDKDQYADIYRDARNTQSAFTGEFRIRNQHNEYRWLLAHGAPRFNNDGSFAGYISGCTDITKQKDVLLELEDKEQVLANAIELAQLGTWKFEIGTGAMTLSRRHADMYGLKEQQISFENYLSIVAESDREEVEAKFRAAMLPDSDGRYDVEYRVVNAATGKTHVIHALGQAYFNNADDLTKMEGTIQDVTVQRELQLALENEVHYRTIELAATNEELQAANEELVSINEELSDSSRRLIRSNEELSQFAYVASHDLQEPVRKISVFVEMLYKSLPQVDERSGLYLQKIDTSANRMLNLIRDVLKHSQILNKGARYEPVDLNKVVADVEKEYDMLIEQNRGTVICDPLPVVDAVEFQMNQLFSNMISNSIKFSIPGKDLRIEIRSQILSDVEKDAIPDLKSHLTYYKISFKDNGIGFNQAHANQIFEIFRRLHSRSEYSGTGIGLATCKKIVENHGGHISAVSSGGEGATFHVILPRYQA